MGKYKMNLKSVLLEPISNFQKKTYLKTPNGHSSADNTCYKSQQKETLTCHFKLTALHNSNRLTGYDCRPQHIVVATFWLFITRRRDTCYNPSIAAALRMAEGYVW